MAWMSYGDLSQPYDGGTIPYGCLGESYGDVETLCTVQVDGSMRLQIQYSVEVGRCMGKG